MCDASSLSGKARLLFGLDLQASEYMQYHTSFYASTNAFSGHSKSLKQDSSILSHKIQLLNKYDSFHFIRYIN